MWVHIQGIGTKESGTDEDPCVIPDDSQNNKLFVGDWGDLTIQFKSKQQR